MSYCYRKNDFKLRLSTKYFDDGLDPKAKSLTRFVVLPCDSDPYINYDAKSLFIDIKMYNKKSK